MTLPTTLRRLLIATLLCGGVATSTLPAAPVSHTDGAHQTVEYEYDQYGRLTRAIYHHQVEIRYAYDANGNLTRRAVVPLAKAR